MMKKVLGQKLLSAKGLILGMTVSLMMGSAPSFANFCSADSALLTDASSTPDSWGGVTLNKTLTLLNGVDKVEGAAYDPNKGEIVFVGDGIIPLDEQIDMDDLVVALRTIYNVNAAGETEDPGITFRTAADWLTSGKDDVVYFGKRRFRIISAIGNREVS